MNEKLVICMPSKNLSVAMYRGTRHVRDSTIIKTWIIIWMGTSRILTLHPRTLKYLTISPKLLKMAPKIKKQEINTTQESQQLVSDEESGSEYEVSDSGEEESDEEMDVSEESEVDEDIVVVSNLFIII